MPNWTHFLFPPYSVWVDQSHRNLFLIENTARVWSKPENITSNETRSAKKPRLWNCELEYKTSDATKNENKPKDCFQLACSNGHLKIAEMMINKAADLKINLNTKGQDGHSAFQLACMGGDLEIERSNCTKVV